MASKRRRRKGKRRFPSHLRKYWFKKKGKRRHRRRKAHHMARRKHRRRRHHRRHHRRGRRRGGGGGSGWMPGREDMKLFIGGMAVGKLEALAKADANFPLNKVPRPITALGYTGGTAVALWLGAKLIGGTIGHYARIGARAAAVAAAYQIGKAGKAFDTVAVQGDDWETGDERYIDDYTMGALQTEAQQMAGIPYEAAVQNAEAYT